ncbi:MAG: four helix bundle protein [Patescibacteria group bacterium]|nr:four helix bundle protein [Patescibacteria group bacterium]
MNSKEFYEKLKEKMDEYAHFIYQISRKFPSDELYGMTSQIRRASLSVILNFIEGFARFRKTVQYNFFEISYGSLKESKYLLHFSLVEKYILKEEYNKGTKMADEIGAMLWSIIRGLKNDIKK